jgi:tRNA nucleotidyltransferase (CCA-adding enzyme)
VGGFVRDLLMGRHNTDMDIVVEGDAIIIAREYARVKGAKLTIHDKFKTATVTLTTGDKIDFATSRTEFYSNPGAAPAVEFSSLRNDLYRRDFTINAMAIRIDDDEFGYLVDYFGGQRDILDKKIRVLHSLSLVDDPTRAFRALRFAARYGFVLGSNTERLLKHAQMLDLFSRIRGSKLFIEIKYILDEEKYMAALLLLKQYGLLSLISPKLAIDNNRQEQFTALEETYMRLNAVNHQLTSGFTLWAVRLALLLYNCTTEVYKQVLADLRVEATLAERLTELYSKSKYVSKKIKSMKTPRPSDIYKSLSQLSDEEIVLTSVALGEKLNYLVFAYMEKDRFAKPILGGEDLKAMGISASKEMGALLKELLYAKLDGKLTTREQEEDYVRSR